jgi:hypothetical protein
MTNMQAEAHDAFEHIFASAGALAFVNEYSGAAALPAPYNAFAERQHTLWEVSHQAQVSQPETP